MITEVECNFKLRLRNVMGPAVKSTVQVNLNDRFICGRMELYRVTENISGICGRRVLYRVTVTVRNNCGRMHV